MALIGQKYYNPNTTYVTDVNFTGYARMTAGNISGTESSTIQFIFLDPSIELNAGTFFDANEIYYLKFVVRKTSKPYNISIVLRGELNDQENSASHSIKTVYIPTAVLKDTDEYAVVETIFTPPESSVYNRITLEIPRYSTDIAIETSLNNLNEVIYDNLILEPIEISGDLNSQGLVRIDSTSESNVTVRGAGWTDAQTLNIKQDSRTKSVIITYGEKTITVSPPTIKSSIAGDQAMLIDDDTPNEERPATNWNIEALKAETDRFNGDWLPVYYFTTTPADDRTIKLQTITNLIKSERESSTFELYKIGLQGRPFTLFTLDGEELRIGPTGIYQLEYPDLVIKKFGIVPPTTEDEQNFFILDYKYGVTLE